MSDRPADLVHERRRARLPGSLRTLACSFLVAGVGAAACSGPPAERMAIGELLPVMHTVVPSDDLFSDTGDSVLLGTGTQVRESSAFGRLLIARGHVFEVGFEATGSSDLKLDVQMRRAPGDAAPTRSYRMLLNGDEILAGDVPSQWRRQVADVQAAAVRPGVNRLTLRFSADADDPVDEPVVPARIRWIQVVPAGRSVAWPDRPSAVETDASGDLVLPVWSLAELAVRLPGAARLRGTLVATAAQGQRPRSLRASVRLRAGPAVDDDGRIRATTSASVGSDPADDEEPLLETTVLPEGEGETLDLDLSPWAGRLVRLRLLVQGPGNGTVTWSGLRFEHAPGERPEPLPRAPVAPGPADSSGLLAGKDVVVILLDAARADAFSAYGAGRPTPAVDALAADGVLFERALTPAPWTAPAVTSLLTGLLPDATGVESWDRRLPKPIPTLGEYFQAAGYHTVMWSQHLLYRTNPTLRRGFEKIVEVDPDEREMLPRIPELLEDGSPSFVFVHLLVPHAPYAPPAPWANRYADPDDPHAVPTDEASFAHPYQRTWDPAVADPDTAAYLRDRYDEMVAWADDEVGRLLDGLRDAGRYDDALVMLLGDHGEAFWEHGSFLHTRILNEEVLRVPLIVKLPGEARAGTRWPDTVSTLDAPATLIDAAGLESPPRLSAAAATVGVQGHSLLPVLTGNGSVPADAYATTRAALFRRDPGRRLLALESRGYKLLVDTVWGDVELYDPAVDRAETTNLAASRPVLALWLRQAAKAQHVLDGALLDAYAGTDPGGTDLDLSDLKALEALGYVQ